MRRWKKADLEELRRLVKEKQSWQVIAAELKRSVDAVRMKAKRLGLSVVVDRGRGSTTTNYEGLMMRVTCDTKRVNTMVRTCSEVVVRCPEESDY